MKEETLYIPPVFLRAQFVFKELCGDNPLYAQIVTAATGDEANDEATVSGKGWTVSFYGDGLISIDMDDIF